MTPTRRRLLQAGLSAPFAAGLAPGLMSRSARAAAPFKVGFVYIGPIGDAGWTYQHDLGRHAVEAALGDKVKTSYVENVPDAGADAERVIRKFATEGNDLIFTTSFGYMNPTLKVAAQFPKLKFEHATGYKRTANVGTYSARFYQGRYLTGIIAGRMTKTNVIGVVGAFPIPEVLQGFNALLLGARSVNPNVVVKTILISSWFDPGKERAAADTLMSQGADVVTNHTDSAATIQAGEEKGIFTIGYDSDMAKFGPKTCLTSAMTDWTGYYVDTVSGAVKGSWKSSDVWGGVKEGMVKLAPINPVVPASVVAEVKAATDGLAAGTVNPFAGPITDQSGKLRVAKGATLDDGAILSMDWLADGVQGKA